MNSKFVCIVDAYSSGNFLADEFKKHGYSAIHVQSTKEIFPILKPSFKPRDFEQNFYFENNFDELKRKLIKYSPICILSGTETGVELADRLSYELGLNNSNGIKMSEARRHKFKMINALAKKNILVAKQFASRTASELTSWAKEQPFKKFVVKPCEGAGAEDVFCCETEDQIKIACEKILHKTNKLGLVNGECVIQEFLEGQEYFLNSVSHAGEHFVCDIWQHQKRSLNNFDFVYDCARLMDNQSIDHKVMRYYLYEVLNALEVDYGPSHAEIMLTKNGPRLIEVGTRLQGMLVPQVNYECVGYSSLDLTVDAYVNPKSFQRKSAKAYRCDRLAMRVNLIGDCEKIVKEIIGEKSLRELESFFYMRFLKQPKMKMEKTINYFTVPGFVLLVHKDRQVLERDLLTIRQIEEEQGIFAYE